MALSPKMLAIIEKVDAADAAYSAGLRATAKEEAEAREKAMPTKLVNLRVAREGRPHAAKKKGQFLARRPRS
jgi:hypothetical protein